MIRIRKAPRRMYPVLQVLCDKLLLEDGHVSVWKSNGEYWIAEDRTSGAIVAYAGLVRSGRYSNVVYFNAAGVIESARGKGIQRRLIRARLRWAKNHGSDWAVTDTTCDNIPSMRNLQACGFRPYWPTHCWRVPGAVYWSRKL